MVNYYIYAKDCSSSTDGHKYYHSNGMKTLEQFKSDVERIRRELMTAGESQMESKIIYLHWGYMCCEVTEENVIKKYNELTGGYMCTEPSMIIRWIKQNYNICGEKNRIKLLYIITDGSIEPAGVKNCFKLNKSVQYETVVFHAFNENLSEIDLSVAASFLKSRCWVYRNYELLDNVDISKEFDYDKINVDNLKTEIKSLKSYIKLKFIRIFKQNSIALQEIDKLKKLRNRLCDELSSKSQKSEVNLETKDRKVFLREFVHTDWYKSLNASDQDAKIDIEKSISTLINYIVSDKKSYAFDALKFDTKFGDFVGEEPIIDVNFTAEQEIEFPDIIMADDRRIPVLILTEVNLLDKMIFCRTKELDKVSPASFNKFKSAMECPLFLMNDPDFSESIGDFYTLNVYKQLLKKTKKTEPRTRRPFYGGLVLTDTELFDEYNDYVLSATYFDSKKVNFNFGLFYFVLWKKCKNHKWIKKNDEEQFKKYVMRRISATVCKIGLSSLPLDPQENVSLPTALWYCVELSSCIFKDDPQNFMHERLRIFYGVAQWMLEILKYLNYDLNLEYIRQRRELIKYVMILKDIPARREKVYFLLEGIFKKVNGFLVSEIEKPHNLPNLNYLKLNHKDLLRNDILEQKVNLSDYIHMMPFIGNSDNSETGESLFKISKKGFPPSISIDINKSFFPELLKFIRKTVINNPDDKDEIRITYEAADLCDFDEVVSLYNLFISCVKDSEKYPTLSEYMEYIVKKKKFNGNLVNIFSLYVCDDAQHVYTEYHNIVANYNATDFVKASKNSSERR